MKYVVSRISESEKALEIIQDVNIAKALHWMQMAWKDVSTNNNSLLSKVWCQKI